MATLLSDSATANNWDNAVRLSDEVNAIFEGSYTVILGENLGKIEAAVTTYTHPADTGSNIYKQSFTYGTRTMTLLIMGMSPTYGNASSTKPTAPHRPSCFGGSNVANLPACIVG